MAEFTTLKDSGKREDMETGSRRDTQEGKSRPDLMNPLVLRRLGMHFANGCDKYGEKNFELGQLTSRYRASLGRHLLDYDEGLKDEDHLSAIIWNAMCIVMNQEFVERGIYPEDLDDHTDYTSKVGFDTTVGKRANEHNDKLREMEAQQEEMVERPHPIEHSGICLGDYEKDTCGDCVVEEECLQIYKHEQEHFKETGINFSCYKCLSFLKGYNEWPCRECSRNDKYRFDPDEDSRPYDFYNDGGSLGC